MEWSEDGTLDLAATEARLPGAFGLQPQDLGIGKPADPDVPDRESWLRLRLAWLADLFSRILAGAGLQWKWAELALSWCGRSAALAVLGHPRVPGRCGTGRPPVPLALLKLKFRERHLAGAGA